MFCCGPTKGYASRFELDDSLKKSTSWIFFQPACVGCNELRDRPKSLFPQVSWIQSYEAFDRQIGVFAGRLDWGHDWAIPWVAERRRSHCVLPILTVLLVSLWQYTRDVIIS